MRYPTCVCLVLLDLGHHAAHGGFAVLHNCLEARHVPRSLLGLLELEALRGHERRELRVRLLRLSESFFSAASARASARTTFSHVFTCAARSLLSCASSSAMRASTGSNACVPGRRMRNLRGTHAWHGDVGTKMCAR